MILGSGAGADASTPGGTVALGSLAPQQLQKIQSDLQREIEIISASLAQLSNAVQRLTASRENAAHMAEMEVDSEVMVPITSSIYLPGKLQDTSKVLIDIGTGFFVEKTPIAAKEYFARRASLLKEEQDRATQIHTQKRQHLEAVSAVLHRKTAELNASEGSSSK
ncbi:Prefoldin [Gracilaria domingensis]|nr:Prefoldin [Gracilaria domingensis]